MKELLTLILGLAVLATLGGLATATPTTVKSSKSNSSERVAVDKATPTPTPNAKATTVKGSKSNGDNRVAVDHRPSTARPFTFGSKSNADRAVVMKLSQIVITGKVTQVGKGTFTLKAKGKEYKFLFPKGGAQPKVGAVVDVTYTGTLGGSEPAQVINLNSSRSNIY